MRRRGLNKENYWSTNEETQFEAEQNQERKVIENDIKLKIVQAMHKRLNHREERFLSYL